MSPDAIYPTSCRGWLITLTALCSTWSPIKVFFDSPWFTAYRKAVLESETGRALSYAEEALQSIGERLQCPNVGETEREAIDAAIRYLRLIQDGPRAAAYD